jgi:hypothetical protein
MISNKDLIGEVFISYSSLDKSFVRKLTTRIQKEGYSVWVDEHKLIVGDPLANKISIALKDSKIILVIISSASLKSKWLKYELNNATEMMIQGKARLIPVVIEDVSLLPEVQGILYADFRRSFKYGIKSIFTALQYEINKNLVNCSFWRQADILIETVFGSTSYASTMGEYESKNYTIVTRPIPFENEEDTEICYESISSYRTPAEPLSENWIEEFKKSKSELPPTFYIILSERPIDFAIDENCLLDNRIKLKKSIFYKEYGQYYIFIDFSQVENREQRIEILQKALTYIDAKIDKYIYLTKQSS